MDSHAHESMAPEFLIAGHVVIDQVIDTFDQKVPRTALGGPISYTSLTLRSLGHRCEAVTKVGFDFPEKYEKMLREKGGIDIARSRVIGFGTTSYKIDRTKVPRKMWLLSRCKTLTIEDFSNYLGDSVNKPGTLIVDTVANEISLSLLERISKEFDLVLADSQGFVRRLPKDNSPIGMKSGIDISSLSGVDVLKADSEELASWSGVADRESAVRQISKFVDVILLTSGPGVVDLYQGGQIKCKARPFEVRVGDTTGAGDIMLSSFAAKFSESRDFRASLAYSVSAATLAVRNIGIEKALLDPSEVEERAKSVVIT